MLSVDDYDTFSNLIPHKDKYCKWTNNS